MYIILTLTGLYYILTLLTGSNPTPQHAARLPYTKSYQYVPRARYFKFKKRERRYSPRSYGFLSISPLTMGRQQQQENTYVTVGLVMMTAFLYYQMLQKIARSTAKKEDRAKRRREFAVLSKRAEDKFLGKKSLQYVQFLVESFPNLWHDVTNNNRDAVINLGVAENKLSYDILLQYVNGMFSRSNNQGSDHNDIDGGASITPSQEYNSSFMSAETVIDTSSSNAGAQRRRSTLLDSSYLNCFTRPGPLPLFTEEALSYTSPAGLYSFRQALSAFMGDYIFKTATANYYPEPEQLVVSSGCGGLLHVLSAVLFDSNESVLVPTPYYPAFDHDFLDIGDVVTVEVNSKRGAGDDPFASDYISAFTVADLNRACAQSKLMNRRPKAVLLTNPNNPLGIVYSPELVRSTVSWATARGMHVIVDEVYALSQYAECGGGVGNMQPFTSVVGALKGKLGENVHVLWSFSKDFCMSGFRVGVLYSQNKDLLRAAGTCNDGFQVSNLTQQLLARMISDYAFVDSFLLQSRRRTLEQYGKISAGLAAIGVRHTACNAGMFVYADFSRYLPSSARKGEEAERALAEVIFRQCGIILTPGKVCHNPCGYGFFRVCFCWVSPAALDEAVRRLHEWSAIRAAAFCS